MPRFGLRIIRSAWVSAVIRVEAEDEDEAFTKAEAKAKEGKLKFEIDTLGEDFEFEAEDASDQCDECWAIIPNVEGGGLANKHHVDKPLRSE